jgi:chromosome segregation ATPase
MAEVSFGGVSFKGGRIVVIITALSTLIGALWGGFEVYSRYLDMEKKIDSYVAPDLSGFDKRLDLIQQETGMLQSEMTMILEEVNLVASVAKELKNDLKADVRRIETIVEDVEQRVKEDGRENSKDLKETVNELKEEMQKLEEKIDKRIKLALENPLSQLNG